MVHAGYQVTYNMADIEILCSLYSVISSTRFAMAVSISMFSSLITARSMLPSAS